MRFMALGAAMVLSAATAMPSVAQTGAGAAKLGPGVDMDTHVGRPPLPDTVRPPGGPPDAPDYGASSGLERPRTTLQVDRGTAPPVPSPPSAR